MKQSNKTSEQNENRKSPMPITDEAREDYLISLAMQNAEERLRNGTAKPSEIVYFLKLGSEKEKARLEKEKMEQEVTLLKAKTEAIQAAQTRDELYLEAIKHMRIYQGNPSEDDDYDESEEEL